MNDLLSAFAARLKSARERKGLTQRALAAKVGLPQGHISRIERAEVDLQTSNLIQLARSLDLELVLVPRQALPAVEALSQQAAAPIPFSHGHGFVTSPLITPAYTLDDEQEESDER